MAQRFGACRRPPLAGPRLDLVVLVVIPGDPRRGHVQGLDSDAEHLLAAPGSSRTSRTTCSARSTSCSAAVRCWSTSRSPSTASASSTSSPAGFTWRRSATARSGCWTAILTALFYVAALRACCGSPASAGCWRRARCGVAVVALIYDLHYPVGALPETGPLRFGLPMVVLLVARVAQRDGRDARAAGRGPSCWSRLGSRRCGRSRPSPTRVDVGRRSAPPGVAEAGGPGRGAGSSGRRLLGVGRAWSPT